MTPATQLRALRDHCGRHVGPCAFDAQSARQIGQAGFALAFTGGVRGRGPASHACASARRDGTP